MRTVTITVSEDEAMMFTDGDKEVANVVLERVYEVLQQSVPQPDTCNFETCAGFPEHCQGCNNNGYNAEQ